MYDRTVEEIKEKLQTVDEEAFTVLERALKSDTRKGVQKALEATRRRLGAEAAESQRWQSLYEYERRLAEKSNAALWVGLDEAGRGPLAGPLAVGAVILPPKPLIEGLNDSKQLSPQKREDLAQQIKGKAMAWSVQLIDASEIDRLGLGSALRKAFLEALEAIKTQGFEPDLVLLDGNAMHLDARERNVIKGDALCASIAAASILAKVTRDEVMMDYAKLYPEYGFDRHKGYASADHREAIRRFGLSPIHRNSFCHQVFQESLFD